MRRRGVFRGVRVFDKATVEPALAPHMTSW
jgi:hypothetical protein